MKKIIMLSFLCLFFSIRVFSSSIIPFTRFHETLRYVGNDPACQKVLNNVELEETYYSDFEPGRGGEIYLSLQNPDSGRLPIRTYLYKNGDEDRYGFANYYRPLLPMSINHHEVGLYALILNICLDGQKQAGAVVYVNGKTSCILSTPIWNYCR